MDKAAAVMKVRLVNLVRVAGVRRNARGRGEVEEWKEEEMRRREVEACGGEAVGRDGGKGGMVW